MRTSLGRGGDAVGTSPPVDDLGLVDLVARVVGGGQAGGVTDRAVDVDGLPARPADEVVVVVADAVLVPGRRAGGLDAPEQPLLGERPEHVVHRLARDGAERGPHDLLDLVGGAVRRGVHRPQHRDALRRHLQPALRGAAQLRPRGAPSTCRQPNREDWTMSRTFSDPDPSAGSADDVLLGVGRSRPFPVQLEPPRRQREDLALRVLVVAVLDRRV